jgi:glycosyltransferase involved in cell wall biosynthesis
MNEPLHEPATPFFSICIDLYNREKTIEEVLISVRNQIFTNFELIIVDNGSTDRSLEICEMFLKKNPQIHSRIYVEERKVNEIAGWNSPIKKAKGKFIAICEGDDYYNPYHLQDAFQILNKNKDYGLYVAGSKLEKFTKFETPSKVKLLSELITFQWCPAPSCTIFLRQIEKNLDTLYNEEYKWAAETHLYLTFLKSNYEIVVNNSQNYVLRGFRFYLKNDYHIIDMIKFRNENSSLYSSLQAEIADLKIFKNALHLFLFNLIFGILNKNLAQLIRRYFRLNKIYVIEIAKIAPRTILNATKQRIKIAIK